MKLKPSFFLYLVAFSFLVISCNDFSENGDPSDSSAMKFEDAHSFAKPDQAFAKHLDLDVKVDFENRVITGVASYEIEMREGAEEIIFDTKDLRIEKVTLENGETPATFSLGSEKEFLGQPLSINLKPGTKRVNITFSTSPGAEALQWLTPEQTAGKEQPFLFTQSQAILARTWLPCQDGPGMRFTYNAKVEVPVELMAVMSASNPQAKNNTGIYSFEMKQPIPAYLMAMAVGDIEFKPVGPRTGVYAEPSVVDAAVYEFGEMEDMLKVAENMYGPYRWERYDLIVLPPSFPFGGMENPRLTFATPTVIAGDRSLTALVAHELAHSWSGNLVTNANWNDFWLNEGFTVYFERRIMEELYDRSYTEMLAMLGFQDLEETMKELGPQSRDTHLKLALDGRNPDDGMTDIAYEKGYFFLRLLEETVGRDKFDAFLRNYFEENAFKVMTSEAFVEELKTGLFDGDSTRIAEIGINDWIYGPGLPHNCPVVSSDRFLEVNDQLEAWQNGTKAKDLKTASWTTHEWLHFIRHLPAEMKRKDMKQLDKAFGFAASGNSEIQAAWFIHVIRNEYSKNYGELEDFLMRVGRRKFLKPLYSEMAKSQSGLEMAREIYAQARPNYHSVSTGTIDEILKWDGSDL